MNTKPTATTFSATEWFKSSFSIDDPNGCVEVALRTGVVGLRDTKDRTIPAHTYSPTAWTALLTGITGGEFDLPDAA